MSAIEITGLRVRRGGNLVLPDLSLSVEAGETTGLLGPSGCGKTTLLRAIVGVQIVEDGRVTVLGEPAGSAPLRSRVAYVTQAPSVYPDLSVRENLRFFARILGVGRERIEQAIETVRLGELADRVVRDTSGGQRARVSLATALLGDPDVLILDEPTVGVDPVLRAELWRAFDSLAAAGKALMVSSHVMDEAANCGRLALMREGRLLAVASPDEILERTGAPDLTEAFLSLIGGDGGAAGDGAGAGAGDGEGS
jgi:ABC-2 type transport system ATP-binding protein